MIDAADFEELSGKSGVWYVYAKAADGTPPDEVRADVAAEIEGIANTQALTYEEFTSYQDDLVDQALVEFPSKGVIGNRHLFSGCFHSRQNNL